MDRDELNIRSTAAAVVALAILVLPSLAKAQSYPAADTARVSSPHYLIQAGIDPFSILYDASVTPSVYLLAAETSTSHTFGASISWIPGSDSSWTNENYGIATLRYYSTDTMTRGAYGFIGLGCIARLRSGKSASDGQTFFNDAIPGTHEATFRPCVDLGWGGSVPLSPKSFVGFSMCVNLNALHTFFEDQIWLGMAW